MFAVHHDCPPPISHHRPRPTHGPPTAHTQVPDWLRQELKLLAADSAARIHSHEGGNRRRGDSGGGSLGGDGDGDGEATDGAAGSKQRGGLLTQPEAEAEPEHERFYYTGSYAPLVSDPDNPDYQKMVLDEPDE